MRNANCNQLRLLVLAVPLLAFPSCHRGADQQTAAPPGAAEQSVPLIVLEGSDGSTFALVPVYIDDHGPFAFALDTGASHSVIDADLADELKLPAVGSTVEVTGVAATEQADQVRVGDWRAGDVPLPGKTMVSLALAQSNRRLKMRGLLGSDVLSRFGAVTVDYDRQRLLLRARPQP